MNLNINDREINGVTIIDLDGTLDTNTSPWAEAEIQELLEKGKKNMIIDLGRTKYVSSAGLRVFLATAKKLMANSGTLMLANPNKIVKDILQVSGFDTIIEVRSTVDEALNEFDSKIYKIPGQSSGICLKYFFILTGCTDFIKPDRMIQRFFKMVLASAGVAKSKISHDQMQQAITGACEILKSDYPWIKPAYLDHFIWRYQRK